MAARADHAQLYLIYGNNETEVSDERFNLVTSLLTPEERDTGLSEVRGPGNQPLQLARCLGEIVGELGTSSFIAGARRVVVVHDLKDFYGASRAAKSKAKAPKKKAPPAPAGPGPAAMFAEWVRDVLPTTENIAVFVCVENDEKMRTVSQTSEMYRLVEKHGRIIQRREKPLHFEMDNHLLGSNPTAAVTLLREWIRRAGGDSSGRMKIYSTLANHVEMLVQAHALNRARREGIPENQVVDENAWPSIKGRSTPDWKAKKLIDLSRRFTPADIGDMVRGVNRLQRLMYPSGGEAYVASWEECAELLVLRMTA